MRKYAAAAPSPLMSLLMGLFMFALGQPVHGATAWTEGRHYVRIQPAQPTRVPAGKIEVAEAFSYGCPACNQFLPIIERMKQSLPPEAEIVYVPASFNPSEQWPLFQRAYLAAKALGIAQRTHDAMFNAIWGSGGELAVVDTRTRRLKQPPPTIEDVAEFYARVGGVTQEQFLATAKSFTVQLDMKRADAWIKACRVDQTPTFVINGKYRTHAGMAGGIDPLIELIGWLVEKESAGAKTQ